MKAILFFLSMMLGGCLAFFLGTVHAQPIVTESTSKSETTVKSPPPSAISPSITTINPKNCSTGVAGAAQTQVFGISFGATVRDENCERVVKAESLFNMQMKTAAVSVMCQDADMWWGMWDGGVPCPVEGKVGMAAKEHWLANPNLIPARPKIK
jgi:hypothetical protein